MSGKQKKFGLQGLSHSAVHHLWAVADSVEQRGYARVSDIARKLEITRGSVSVTMQSLKAENYVTQDENHFFGMTAKGHSAIASIKARHKVVERFLQEVLGLSEKKSHNESCKMENLIGVETTLRLSALLDYWNENRMSQKFKPETDGQCQECTIANTDRCPCCGLECIDNICLKKQVISI